MSLLPKHDPLPPTTPEQPPIFKEEVPTDPAFLVHVTKDGFKLWIRGLITREALIALAMLLVFALIVIICCLL